MDTWDWNGGFNVLSWRVSCKQNKGYQPPKLFRSDRVCRTPSCCVIATVYSASWWCIQTQTKYEGTRYDVRGLSVLLFGWGQAASLLQWTTLQSNDYWRTGYRRSPNPVPYRVPFIDNVFPRGTKNVGTNELAQVRTKGDIFLRKRQALDLIRGSKEKGLSTKYCCQPLLVATLDPLNLLFVRQKNSKVRELRLLYKASKVLDTLLLPLLFWGV